MADSIPAFPPAFLCSPMGSGWWGWKQAGLRPSGGQIATSQPPQLSSSSPTIAYFKIYLIIYMHKYLYLLSSESHNSSKKTPSGWKQLGRLLLKFSGSLIALPNMRHHISKVPSYVLNTCSQFNIGASPIKSIMHFRLLLLALVFSKCRCINIIKYFEPSINNKHDKR